VATELKPLAAQVNEATGAVSAGPLTAEQLGERDTVQAGLEQGEDSVATIAAEGQHLLPAQNGIETEISQVDGNMLSQLQDFLQTGGPVVWILIALSVLALCIILIKLWQLTMLRPESKKDLDRALLAWREGEQHAAIAKLDAKRPVSAVTKLAMQGLVNNSSQPALLKEELQRVATKRMSELRSYLRPLEVIATLSPLLGLLGTVLGMIAAFQQMELAGSQVDPSVLSGGIWQALLTTAVGLSVAIPVMAMHNWLERKAERVSELLNDSVTQVFTQQDVFAVEQEIAAGIKRAA